MNAPAALDWTHEVVELAAHLLVAGTLLTAVGWSPVRRRLAGLLEHLGRPSPARFAVLVVLLTVGVRLAGLPLFEQRYHFDAREYVEKAQILLETGSPHAQEWRGWMPAGPKYFFRTLGYSLALAPWFLVTGGGSVLAAQLFNILVAAATAVGLVRLGRHLDRPLAGRVAAVLFALHLPQWMFSLHVYAETFAAGLVVGAALACEATEIESRGRRVAAALGAGLCLGWLVITRTELLWLPPLALGWIAWRRLRVAGAREALALVAVFLAGAAVPVTANHTLRHGYPGTLRTSVQGGLILYFGNNPIEVVGHGNASPAVVAEQRRLYVQDTTGGAARDAALEWMAANPLAVLANAPKKLYFLWLAAPEGFGWRAQAGQPGGLHPRLAWVLVHAAHVQSLLVLVAGVLGLVSLRRRGAPWLVVIALHAGMFALLAPVPRNRLVLEPLVLVGAAVHLVRRVEEPSA